MPQSDYTEEILEWREKRNREIIANPRNWLTLAGLYPLHEGKNAVSALSDADIQLPPSAAPFSAVFTLSNDNVQLTVGNNTGLRLDEELSQGRPIRKDVDGDPDILEIGQYFLMVIRRGDRFFLRLWDNLAPDYVQFPGLRYFPVNPEFLVMASFEGFNPPKINKAYNAIGVESETEIAGVARFSIAGIECSLLAESSGDELLFNFTDATRVNETYPGGRYLEVPRPDKDKLVLDFNLARNWPCAYTPYATCPLPLRENQLAVRIEAGEMRFH
jgi:uncharacterized protein (DUF1684 family)